MSQFRSPGFNRRDVAAFKRIASLKQLLACRPKVGAKNLQDPLEALADVVRRGRFEGCALRMPGMVAGPGDGGGWMSAFMSQLFWHMEAESFFVVPESQVQTPWIEAQTTAIARAMARICNDEPGCLGVQGGHGEMTLSLSVCPRLIWPCKTAPPT
jgi:hypothetical protein